MPIFVRKEDLVTELVQNHVFSIYKKRSASNMTDIGASLASHPTGSALSSTEEEQLRKEFKKFVKKSEK